MAKISKVIFGGETLIDLTADTIQADKLLKGYTAHSADGEQITGSCTFDANTQDATATSAEILSGKTAYNKAVKVTGTMKNNGAATLTISKKDDAIQIPQGFHDGGGKASISASEQAKLIPNNIRQGVVVLGVTGTMSGSEGVKAQAKTVTPTVSGFEVNPDTGYTHLSSVTISAIPYNESDNSAGGTTVSIA